MLGRISRINEYWKEGHYLDLWSVNHVLSGVVLGATLFNLGVGFWPAFGVASLLFVGWEILELVVDIKEHFPNMIMDVVCDFLGFFLVVYAYFVIAQPFTWMATVILFLDFLAINLWGYTAYRDRKKNELAPPAETIYRLTS